MILQKVPFIIIMMTQLTSHGQGFSPFTMEPRNKTVNFGEIVEFECRVNHMHHLVVFIGRESTQTELHPEQRPLLAIDEREFNINVNVLGNERVGRFWIFINNNTISVMEYFYCKVFHDNFQVDNSSRAYIRVQYPECMPTPMAHQSTILNSSEDSLSLPQTSPSQNIFERDMPTSPGQTIYERDTPTVASPGTLNLEPCSQFELKNASNTDFYYKVALGVCAGMASLMFLILVLSLMCICFCRRKVFIVKSARNTTNQVCKNMVHNPIYDGPVYESVHPHFESLTTQVTAATNCGTDNNHHDLELASSLEDTSEKIRYVTQTGFIQSGAYIDDHHDNGQLLQEDNGYSASINSIMEDRSGGPEVQLNKEDAYTVMNPAETSNCSTLNDGVSKVVKW